MNNETKDTIHKELGVSTLLKVLRKNLVIILAIAIIFAAIAGAYSVVFGDTTYSVTLRYYVKNILTTSGYVTESMLNAGALIADACVVVANTEYLVDLSFEEFALDEYFNSPSAKPYVTSMINAGKADKDSQEFYITVTSGNADHTLRVAQAINGVMDELVKDITTGSADSVSAPELLRTNSLPTEAGKISPQKPSAAKMAIIGALAGIVLSYAVCLIIFINDTKVYDEQTLKTNFKEPILASIPQWISKDDTEAQKMSKKKLRARDVSKATRKYQDKLLNADTPFAITESFKLLRTNLLYSKNNDGTPVFAVTSDFSGAGKSMISANLALAFAQFDKKTLLVECDMRCPDFQHIFAGRLNEVGLSELLSSNVDDVSKVPVSLDYKNLSIISSGRIPPNPSELLGSERMTALVNEWKREYDAVILDLPPVFEVTDACVISGVVDGYIMVARTEHSDLDALASAIDNIQNVHGEIRGFVVNDVDLKTGSAQYNKRSFGKYGKYGKYSVYSDTTAALAEENKCAEACEAEIPHAEENQ